MTGAHPDPAAKAAEQPLGEPVDFAGAAPPEPTVLAGSRVVLRPIDVARDAEPLYAASHPPTGDPSIWTYMYEGPYPDLASFRDALSAQARARARPEDRVFFTVADAADDRARGVVSYLSIVPEHGTIEVGNIWFAPSLQRTTGATEAIHLLAEHAFDKLGYRRLEWKCNACNAPSRRAAARLGFQYEGTFLNHRVVKGRNRDTAWFAITDSRWPQVHAALRAWLDPSNFDSRGRQRARLADFMTAAGPPVPAAVPLHN